MKTPTSGYDRLADAVCLLCLVGTGLFLAAGWQAIPGQIPGHYNAAGEVDRMTGKGSLIFLLVLAWMLFLGLSLLERFPQVWNAGMTAAKEKEAGVYRVLKTMLKTVKLLLVLLFCALIVMSSRGLALPPTLLPAFLLLLIGNFAAAGVRLFRTR